MTTVTASDYVLDIRLLATRFIVRAGVMELVNNSNYL